MLNDLKTELDTSSRAGFLEVRVESETVDIFPRVRFTAAHRRALDDGWVEVFVPMSEFNPAMVPFSSVSAEPLAHWTRG